MDDLEGFPSKSLISSMVSNICDGTRDDGIALTNVQKLLGHKNVQTTTGYIQENPMLLGKISALMSM